MKEITGQEFGKDAEKWKVWWANNSSTFKGNKTSDNIDAKWLYKQVWRYHERGERDNLLESLLLLAKSFPDSEETLMAFKSFASSNYFNKEEQKKLRTLFNKYKKMENATCLKCSTVYALGTKCKCENKIDPAHSNKEIIIDKKAGKSSVIGMIFNNQVLRYIPLVAGFIIFKNGPAAVPFVIAFLYPIVIYFDSKKRLGKPSWGWTFGGLFLFIGGLVQFDNILITEESNSLISAKLGSLIGGLVGLWLGNL